MSADPPESSSQALERFLSSKLTGLSLNVPNDDAEMIARFVEEEGIERDEKIEGVRGMLEGYLEEHTKEVDPERVDEAMGEVVDEWVRLQSQQAEGEEEEESSEEEESPQKLKDVLASLTPEELEAVKRQALLREYGYIEGDDIDIPSGRDGHAPPRGETARTAQEKAAAEERRQLIEKALMLDGKKKKHRKKQEVDLLAPNLNREKLAYKAQVDREAAKKASQAKKERDKAALDKQRNDAAKAKADKQKKAAKQERRA